LEYLYSCSLEHILISLELMVFLSVKIQRRKEMFRFKPYLQLSPLFLAMEYTFPLITKLGGT